jgi:hypothetical protein
MRYTTKYLDSRSHCAQQAQPHYVQLPRSVWEMSGPPLDMPAYYYYNSGGGGGGGSYYLYRRPLMESQNYPLPATAALHKKSIIDDP